MSAHHKYPNQNTRNSEYTEVFYSENKMESDVKHVIEREEVR